MTKPLILIDGSSYLFRAYYALPALTNSQGQPTGAIYGVINMLKKCLKEYQPERIAVVFDPKGKTFRSDLYPEYKANRTKMPDELASQIPPLFRLIKALGLPLIIVDGVEADDVIGTLAKRAEAEAIPVIISTGDKDLAQLVNPHISLINTMTNTLLDEVGVFKKFGVNPNQIIDYLSLVGDSVDNIKGVTGVGPKTAAKWLAEYLTLDNIIVNINNIKGKVGDNLREALNHLPLTKQLITIKCDVEIPFSLDDLCPQALEYTALKNDYATLEFSTWLKELNGEVKPEHTATMATSHYHVVLDDIALQHLLTKLKNATLIAVDTETTSLNYMQAELVGLSFSMEVGEAFYIPLAHDYLGAPKQLDRLTVLNQLKPILENAVPKKVGQNCKYDMSVLARYNIHLRGVEYDTMLESYVLNSTGSRHDMDTLAEKFLNHKTVHFEDIAGTGANQLTFNQINLEQAAHYAAEDADITLQLHRYFSPKLAADSALSSVFNQIEMPLVPVLSTIERTGVLIDTALLTQQSTELTHSINHLTEQAYSLAGQAFNLSSPKQLQTILFDKMQLPITHKTPSGQASTAEDALEALADQYELPRVILQFRQLSKLKSTYVDRLPEQVDPHTGRVHTSYHQATTSTGRLSSSDPNLQNIPIKSAEGRRIRQAFIAPPGYKIIAADYSQIELRIMAHLSGDRGLLKAFQEGLDIHSATAAEVFNTPLTEVTALQRRNAKAINFGLIYGMSGFGLARQLGIERREAESYIQQYFTRYPEVKNYMENTRRHAHEQGFVSTLCGRRLYLPEINARNAMRQKASERAAINAPMQGTAADIIKLAMIKLHQLIMTEQLPMRMIMQVHDELVFEVQEDAVSTMTLLIEKVMSEVLSLDVPLVVDSGVGDNWEIAH